MQTRSNNNYHNIQNNEWNCLDVKKLCKSKSISQSKFALRSNQSSQRTETLVYLNQAHNFEHKQYLRIPEKLNTSLPRVISLERANERKLLRKYRMLFDYSKDIFLILDLKGNILEANSAAVKAYGYHRCELNSLRIHDLRSEETRNIVDSQIQTAFNNGITFETYHLKKTGERFSVEVSSFRFDNFLLSFVRDITKRKQSEMEYLKNEKIKVIGKVAAGVAHEIRNSITSVHGFLQLAARRTISQEKLIENCDLMLQELNHANFIISELMLIENNRRLNLENRSLNQIINDLFPLLDSEAKSQGKTIEIILNETPQILLDEDEIRKLIIKIVSNALESMTIGGNIKIKTETTETALSLLIEDNGSGIKKEILGQLGTPFLTTKDSGVGLGLVICNSIIMRHNGTLDIISSSHGTTVKISFNYPKTFS